jgi:hypothetical protein
MSDVKQTGSDKSYAHINDDELRAIARKLFIAVDMVRAFDDDYDVAVKVLRDVYDRGRSQGYYEAQDGAMF